MVSEFSPALDVVLAHEGGWSNDAADPGGPTSRGITFPIFREWAGDQATFEQFRELSRDDAAAIYRVLFWDRHGLDRVDDQDCATKLFDAVVNLGPRTAFRLAQLACAGAGQTVDVDGVLGPQTLTAINACQPRVWLREMALEMAEHYDRLVSARPMLARYLSGWKRRAVWPWNAEVTA